MSLRDILEKVSAVLVVFFFTHLADAVAVWMEASPNNLA